VYAAQWRGQDVAVKVLMCDDAKHYQVGAVLCSLKTYVYATLSQHRRPSTRVSVQHQAQECAIASTDFCVSAQPVCDVGLK